MAFDSNIVVIKRNYNEELVRLTMSITNRLLGSFGIQIVDEVSTKEYENMTSSKEINRYIRVRKATLKKQKEEAKELVKVGTSRIKSFEQFSSAKYAFCSISDMEDGKHTVIWLSFHSRLYQAFPEFQELSFWLAREISRILSAEGYALGASSMSRNSDRFVLYVRGRERNKLATKGALTEVRKMYEIDINKLMMNVDKNMAIHYAAIDYKEVLGEIRTQEKRYSEWKEHRNEITLENKEDGSNMIETFEKENEVIMTGLKDKLKVVEEALRTEPIGKVVYFKMNDLGETRPYLPENEKRFGREVEV